MPTKLKKRILLKRCIMRKQRPRERITNFDEVTFGFSEKEALHEASRCLQCPKPACVEGCPVDIDVKSFIHLIQNKDYEAALLKIKEKNSLPGICGRVCPQEVNCELGCPLRKQGDPVAIGALERFAADHGQSTDAVTVKPGKTRGVKVTIIGSGPAGLTAAGDLAGYGFDVTIFEALHKPGGVLTYGIPEFRLPRNIVKEEIKYLSSLGVTIQVNTIIGRTMTLQELFTMGFKAIFIASGAGSPKFLHIPGENLNGVYSANEFLTRCNLMKAYRAGEYDTPIYIGTNVAVIGGGNTAMDAARTALRLGAENVTILYRRSKEEIPARAEEVQHAREEGVQFHFLTAPTRFISADGGVSGIECLKMKLGEPDSSGRRRPIPIEGSTFTFPVDMAIIAIGQNPNPTLTRSVPELKTDNKGSIIVDETCRTSIAGVWAGGDIVTEEDTVINAMQAGKRAAKDIAIYLKKK